MASLWRLPIIYLCENNGFGEYTRCEEATLDCQPIGGRAAAFGIPTVEVDGNDVIAVYQAVREAVVRARTGEGPSYVEAHTYRLSGHHMGDVGFGRGYRNKEELEERRSQEPIGRFRQWLMEDDYATSGELADIDAQVEAEMHQAVDFVKQSPVPDIQEAREHVYA